MARNPKSAFRIPSAPPPDLDPDESGFPLRSNFGRLDFRLFIFPALRLREVWLRLAMALFRMR